VKIAWVIEETEAENREQPGKEKMQCRRIQFPEESKF